MVARKKVNVKAAANCGDKPAKKVTKKPAVKRVLKPVQKTVVLGAGRNCQNFVKKVESDNEELIQQVKGRTKAAVAKRTALLIAVDPAVMEKNKKLLAKK